MTPTAILGAGAIGMALAAHLDSTGHPVTLVGGRPRTSITLTTPTTTSTHPVAHEPVPTGPAELVVVAVKAHQTPELAGALRVLCAEGTTVLVAQNGVEHRERLAPFTGPAAIVPAIAYLNAERTAVDRTSVRSTPGPDLLLPDDDAARAVAGRFAGADLRVATTSDFTTALWTKLLLNVTGNPITALTGRRAEVLRDEHVGAVAEALLTEAVAVGRAEGADLPDDAVAGALAWLRGLADGATSSMLQDREAGSPLENDALTGAVLRAADRHGLPVPTHRTVNALLGVVNRT
ncbi:ketopantoate reductase family protein [Actinokineospora bangkokensis]|uniref:2-dehydropantoate 2-reductase n=1 Tax=Actinokineospora bangkokensis TaxID=1193682 RepID=A0A1Q9LL62_9PSEU|nr:2-dehydropantoate 2-reductase [Actinokineospora bangkokensis]OLR92787.1 hypothetical protein BJP25_19345 [Actinokineospora bangkokensis]